MTRRTLLQTLRDALGRRNAPADVPRTRIVTPHWRRASEIVHPESDLSEWVHKKMVSDWDTVKKGRNKK